MTISDNKVVALIYTLVVDGQVADKTTEERPLEFIFGTGMLLPKFEEYLLDKKPGDDFKFTLSPAEGYGEYDEQAVIELPKKVFEVEGKVREDLLVVGNMIQMMNNAGGIVPGVVKEVKAESVIMDFNSQMAGKTLNFTGKILTVREATAKEIEEGLHGEKKHSCGGSCSSCGGGCGDCK